MIKISNTQIVLMTLLLNLLSGRICCQTEFSWLPQRWSSRAQALNEVMSYKRKSFQLWIINCFSTSEKQWTDFFNQSLSLIDADRTLEKVIFDRTKESINHKTGPRSHASDYKNTGSDAEDFSKSNVGSLLLEPPRIRSKRSTSISNVFDRRHGNNKSQRTTILNNDLDEDRSIVYRYLRQTDSIKSEDLRNLFERTDSSMSFQTVAPTVVSIFPFSPYL
jgi:hypothetical protein